MKSPDIQEPQAAPFFPLDISGTATAAQNQDITSWNLSDQDFLTRYPGLVQMRDQNIHNAYDALTGPLPSELQNSFVKEGLSKSIDAFGGGGADPGMVEGSSGKNAVASTVAGKTQEYKDYTRGIFSDLIAQNLPRAAGLSGSNVAQLAVANTGNLNASNQANFANQVGIENANNAADTAATNANVSTAIAVATTIAIIA